MSDDPSHQIHTEAVDTSHTMPSVPDAYTSALEVLKSRLDAGENIAPSALDAMYDALRSIEESDLADLRSIDDAIDANTLANGHIFKPGEHSDRWYIVEIQNQGEPEFRINLNITVNCESVDELYRVLVNHNVTGYFKFNQASLQKADSIVIYIQEEPTQELQAAINELSERFKREPKYLIGTPINQWATVSKLPPRFTKAIIVNFQTSLGSAVSAGQIPQNLYLALEMFTTGGGRKRGVSEGELQVVTDVLQLYGYTIDLESFTVIPFTNAS